MTLTNILVFIAVALVGGFLAGRWRGWFILLVGVFSLYWLQPALPIRNLDFWLPTASLALVLLGWGVTRPKNAPLAKADLAAGGAMLAVALLVGLLRRKLPPDLYARLEAEFVELGALAREVVDGRVQQAFQRESSAGLFELAAHPMSGGLPPQLAFWRDPWERRFRRWSRRSAA